MSVGWNWCLHVENKTECMHGRKLTIGPNLLLVDPTMFLILSSILTIEEYIVKLRNPLRVCVPYEEVSVQPKILI